MAATNAPKNWFIAQDNGMQFISHSFSLVKRADNCLINNNNNNNQYDCKMNTSKQMRFFNYNVNACKKQIATSSQLVVVDQNQQPPCNISATTTTSATFIIDNHNAIINNCGSNKKKRTTKQNLDNCSSGCVNGITKPKKMMKAIHATTPQIEFQFIPCYFTPKGKEKNDNLTCCSSPSNVSCCGSHDEHYLVALSSPTLSNSSMSNDFINLTVNNSLMGNNDKLIDEKKKLSSCTTTTRRTSISIRELLN